MHGPTHYTAPNTSGGWPGRHSRDIEEWYVVIRNFGRDVPLRRGGRDPAVNHSKVTRSGICVPRSRLKGDPRVGLISYVEGMEDGWN